MIMHVRSHTILTEARNNTFRIFSDLKTLGDPHF